MKRVEPPLIQVSLVMSYPVPRPILFGLPIIPPFSRSLWLPGRQKHQNLIHHAPHTGVSGALGQAFSGEPGQSLLTLRCGQSF